MKSIYTKGAIFRSKKQKSFKVFCTGHETISTFECLKLRSDGTVIIDDYRNFSKDLWELEIQPNEEQKQIKESLNNISKNIADISKMLQYMNTADIVCSLGANISLININISKVNKSNISLKQNK